MGKRYSGQGGLGAYVGNDFLDVLWGIEAFHDAVVLLRKPLDSAIKDVLAQSELDIGVHWKDGKFHRVGAELLDEALINDQMAWLRRSGHDTVLEPFAKALRHLLESESRPELLSDVITDAYEALEALAKKVTGKNWDLSTAKQLFIKEIGAGKFHEHLLSRYIDYAGDYGHAKKDGPPRPPPSKTEAEFFVYLTGLFLRLAMEKPSEVPAGE